MFPGANKNLQRLQRLRWVMYLALTVAAFVVLGIKTLLAHRNGTW